MIEIKIEQDQRYRVVVMLHRSYRPAYYKFFCPRCGNPVCDLQNTEVQALTDVMDMTQMNVFGPGVRCSGRLGTGYCRTWYYFSLGE